MAVASLGPRFRGDDAGDCATVWYCTVSLGPRFRGDDAGYIRFIYSFLPPSAYQNPRHLLPLR